MDWKQFISSLIQNMAWPIVTLVMFFMVRDQIGKLIEKLGHLKYKDLELDFDKVKRHADALSQPKDESIKVIKDSESEKVFNSLEEQILATVEKAPSASILLAWSSLETSIASAVSRLAISPESPSFRSPLHNIDMLQKYGGVSEQHINLLHEMRTLRNKITHEHKELISVTEEQAQEYASAALDLVDVLNDLKRNKKKLIKPRGEWTRLPEGFQVIKDKPANLWNYSRIKIPGSELYAGLGPWSSAEEEEHACYGIDIERQTKNGDEVISELTFDLKHVYKDCISKQALDLISYDKETKTIKFDLGNSVFEYQLK